MPLIVVNLQPSELTKLFVVLYAADYTVRKAAWMHSFKRGFLPMAAVADANEVLIFIERHKLHGKGIGYVDVHLLASVALTDGAEFWTRDKRLRSVAQALGCAREELGAH